MERQSGALPPRFVACKPDFSTLFLWAFPHQWGLLPWKGSFYDDLWKIGPFIGLFSFAGVPTVMIFVTLMRLLANPEFASEQPRAVTRHPLETPPPVSPSTVLQGDRNGGRDCALCR